MRTSPRLPVCLLAYLLVGFALLAASPATALRGQENYPKVSLITIQVGDMTSAQLDSIAWYDVIAFPESPIIVERIRARNPKAKLFFLWMPQNIVNWGESETFWYPDTSWSLNRLSQFYAQKNDWYLRDVWGERIPEWGGWAANWTRYCPRGTYGTSRGLTYVEWLTERAIPQIVQSGDTWSPWGWESSAYQGIFFEVLADCVGSFGWQTYQYADPDRDGVAEGVYHPCSVGGDMDSLSILYREMNEVFHDGLWPAVGDEMPIIMNAANRFINPAWWTDVSGIKIESWLSSPPYQQWQDWRRFFYGLRNFNGQDVWGPGYLWSEWLVGHTEDDARNGWDLSMLQVFRRDEWDDEYTERKKRLGLGTSLLGEGYFSFTKDQRSPMWQPEYDWDLGEPIQPFARETYAGQTSFHDTLYVRIFGKGFVEVNPNRFPLHTVPAEDARFSFWRTVLDLSAVPRGRSAVEVFFTAPPIEPNPVDAFELRYDTRPIDESNWDAAVEYELNPITAPPGKAVSVVVDDLRPSTVYYFELRNIVHGRAAPHLSNLAVVTTETGADDPPVISLPEAEARGVLLNVRPNPSSGDTRIDLVLPIDEGGELSVIDSEGRRVVLLADIRSGDGVARNLTWDGTAAGRPVPNGVYWIRFAGPERTLTRRVILAR